MNNQPMPPTGQLMQQGQQMQPQTSMMPSTMMDKMEDMSMNDIQNNSMARDRVPRELRKFMDMENIAEDLDDKQLEKISEICLDGFDIDKESRIEWEEIMKKAFNLVEVGLEAKNTPWEGAANIKYPLVSGACIQFNARTNPEIIKNERVVEVRLMSPDDMQHNLSNRAYRLSSHMSYQLISQSTHWVIDTDKLLMMLPMMGTVFRKSFFNTITGQPDTTLCMPEDVVINEKVQSLESCQRVSHVLCMTSNELIEGMKAGLYLEHDLRDLTTTYVNINESTIKEEEKVNDVRIPQSFTTSEDNTSERTYDVSHEIIEQHRWLDLDGDSYQEPYIVTVHKGSRKILRIVARYDESSFEFNDKGEFTKINAINYFTDYHFIPNPNGNFYSLGFGTLLLETNETINSILNQLIDAGTLSNRQSGFIGSDVRMPKGVFQFKPGEWKQLPSTPGSVISQNIVPLPIKEPSQTLFQLMQFLIESSRQITSVSDIMSGETPNPNVPATTTMALLEQSQQVYSSILYRIYDSLKKEFEKLYDLNKKYLKEEETFPIAEQMMMITIQDYQSPNYGIFPVADPKVSSSMQRIAQGQALLDLTKFPQINVVEVLLNYLQILKISDPKAYINQEAPPPPEALKVMAETKKIEMETTNILMERELDALKLGIQEKEQLSKAMYYGGDLAAKKITSAKEIVEMETMANPIQVARAIKEEEVVSHGTQAQNLTVSQQKEGQGLQELLAQLMLNSQQKIIPPPQPQGQEGGMPPEGGIPIPGQ